MVMKFENLEDAVEHGRVEARAIRFGDYDQMTDPNGAKRLAETFDAIDEMFALEKVQVDSLNLKEGWCWPAYPEEDP